METQKLNTYYELLNKIVKVQTGRAERFSGNTAVLTKLATTLAENGHKRETQGGTAV